MNTVATYGRSLFALLLGLFSARWMLQGLGKVDLGLFNVVGGIIPFVTLLNGILWTSVARYYAYVIGEESTSDEEESTEVLRQWFSTAFFLHTIIPVVLVSVFYPVGIYAVHHWFVIPPDRVIACEWVVRFAFVSAFIAMASAPYIAMYSARQLIAELAFFGVLQTILYAISAYMVTQIETDRLILFAGCSCAYLSLTNIVQVIRARMHFPACRLRFSYMFDMQRIRQLFSFSFWSLLGTLGSLGKDQGTAFLVNGYFGAGVNAAYSIAGQVSNHTMSLSSALQGALAPAVTTAEGANDHVLAMSLANRCCKFTTIMLLVFCVPVVMEIRTLLKYWLVTPPEYTEGLCVCMIAAFLISRLAEGYSLAIAADGRIAFFQTVQGVVYLSVLPAIYVLFKMGYGPISIGVIFIGAYFLLTVVRVAFGKRILGASVRGWCKEVAIPVVVVLMLSLLAGLVCTCAMSATLLRVFVTGGVVAFVCLVSSWFFALDLTEKKYIVSQWERIKKRII